MFTAAGEPVFYSRVEKNALFHFSSVSLLCLKNIYFYYFIYGLFFFFFLNSYCGIFYNSSEDASFVLSQIAAA